MVHSLRISLPDLIVKNIFRLAFLIIFPFAGSIQSQDPCNDEMYLEIKKMHLDSMSERQYQYFIQKDRYCTERYFQPDQQLLHSSNNKSGVKEDTKQTDISKGWIRISTNADDVKIFIDGEFCCKGSNEIQLTSGVHKITAKTESKWDTKFVEVFKNDISSIEFNLEPKDSRRARFFMSFDASWMLGRGIEFGPGHMVGVEIDKKHLLAINYYWGLPIVSEEMYGGGVQYMHTFNYNDIFLIRLGGGTGFWCEFDYLDYDDYFSDSPYNWRTFYFGGPKARFEVGYKHVYFVIADVTCLMGIDGMKSLLSSGVSFRL